MSEPQSANDRITDAWRRHRPSLVNLAYQILGDVGDAEDVAQEAFLRLSRADLDEIEDVRAWLTVVAGRLCLDQVCSACARYERPGDIGPETAALNQSPRLEPADRVTLDDEVRTALLEVMRRLSPGERVSIVLHDVFGMPFDAIAETVGRPVGTCRQLARRARTKFAVAQPKPGEVPVAEHHPRAAGHQDRSHCRPVGANRRLAVFGRALWARREEPGDRGGNLEEFTTRRAGHLVGHVDDAAGPQVRIEGHLHHRLPAVDKLTRQQRTGALVGMPVGIVEHHHGALQQAGTAMGR